MGLLRFEHRGRFRWGGLLARLTVILSLADLAVAAYWAVERGVFAQGCGREAEAWSDLGHCSFLVAGGLTCFAIPILLFIDRKRGRLSLACSLATMAVFIAAPSMIC